MQSLLILASVATVVSLSLSFQRPLNCDIPNSPPAYLLNGIDVKAPILPQSASLPDSIGAPLDAIGATYIPSLLPPAFCASIISAVSSCALQTKHSEKNLHSSLQLFADDDTIDYLTAAILPHIKGSLPGNKFHGPATFKCLNRRFRLYKYEGESADTFLPHIDAGWPPSHLIDRNTALANDTTNPLIGSRFSLLLYLTDSFDGGETTFLNAITRERICQIKPSGRCLAVPASPRQ